MRGVLGRLRRVLRGLGRILGWLRRVLRGNRRVAGLAGIASARLVLAFTWVAWVWEARDDASRALSGSQFMVFHPASKRLMHGHRE